MSQPDYENKPDMTWEEFVKLYEFKYQKKYDDNTYACVGLDCAKFDILIYEDKQIFIEDSTDRFVNLGTFKSFKAIKRVITAILEGVER